MCASYTNLGTKIMQKGFILRDGCSETDFQSTHHCCSTHEAVRLNNITYMRSSEICMHMCTHKNPHWIKSPCVHACLKILHEALIITTPISIHCFKDLWHCWIKKQFSTSKYNSWKPVFRWDACYGCMGWSWTCYTYTDQTNPVLLATVIGWVSQWNGSLHLATSGYFESEERLIYSIPTHKTKGQTSLSMYTSDKSTVSSMYTV